jgi:transposase-like protein
VYIGDQKVRVNHPRLRGDMGEVPLPVYERLREPGAFSEELLAKVMRGLSTQKYRDTVIETANAFGVSPGSISNHIVDITAKKLKEFKERSLRKFRGFSMYLDTIHRGGEAFMVALGVSLRGKKKVLGFWEGATENHELCKELLADLEKRGLKISSKIIFITDGGKGIIKALRERIGKTLLHARCAIHKSRNIQRVLAKKYRKEAHKRLMDALKQNLYADAKKMLRDLERWLRGINESAADSLNEAFEELLTLHRIKVPGKLRRVLYTTNPIESMFSGVRDCESNVKRYRGSKMMQRWLATILLHCEQSFKRVRGYRTIPAVVAEIERQQATRKQTAEPQQQPMLLAA